jgi:RNA polymerase sigma-70 factor (ECF subfamily)
LVIRVPDQRTTVGGGYAALDDRLLVLDFQAGNPQAFVEIHHRYGGLARNVCQRFLRNQQDAEEAFQETMIRVYQGLYRFNGGYALQPWIARIAKNVSLDALRGQARRPQREDSATALDDLPGVRDEADEIVERLVQRDTVLAVLSDLPDTHRRALMLRELDGRSHREIAQEMEISTGQAKALIHRAKGSFRRKWLEKVAERGGLMGIAFVPLLWLTRLAGGLRRIGDRFGHAAQTAQAAAPEALTSTVSASAAPVVSTGVGERLVAAGMTLLVAGGVTVGAAKIVKNGGGDEGAAVRAVGSAVAQTAPVPAVDTDRPTIEDPLVDKVRPERDSRVIEPPVLVEAEPSPTVEPSPTMDPSPSEAPSPSPEPPPPPPPPAPEWSMRFASDLLGESTALSLVTSKVEGTAERSLVFSQTATADLVDPKRGSIHVYIEYWGSADGDGGSADFWLFVDTAAGRYEYRASAGLTTVTLAEDGSAVYGFTGSYTLTSAPAAAEEDMPHDGSIALSLAFWSDGTSLYESDLRLAEASA